LNHKYKRFILIFLSRPFHKGVFISIPFLSEISYTFLLEKSVQTGFYEFVGVANGGKITQAF